MSSLAFLVPTRNRRTALARSLPGLLRAARRSDAQVWICDQSAEAASAPGANVLHRPDLGGLPAARNALLNACTADLVCFLDDDCDVAVDIGMRLLALAGCEPGVAAWGPVCETRPAWQRRIHRMLQLGGLADPRRLLGRRCDRPTTALFGCCFAVRRAAALAVGGFDARLPGYALGEDLDFFLRLHEAGFRARFVRDLHAWHRCESSGRADAWRRGVDKGAFLVRTGRRHGRRDPAAPLHAALALAAACTGRGREPAHPLAVLLGAMRGR